MRDYDEDYLDEVSDNAPRQGLGTLRSLALIGAVALIAAPAIKSFARKWRVRHPLAAQEAAIDESLEETYPASDPPASRYVDVPENRR
jgi:hypothetical protein